jgi:hypothetical protein
MTDRDVLIARLRAIGQDMGVVASVLMRTARDGNDDQKSIERLNAWRGEILAVMDALSTPPPAPMAAPGSPLPLEHARTCGDAYDPDARCTCGLAWRVRLVTEQEMHAAWRKRAEEAEATIAATPPPADLVALVREMQEADRLRRGGERVARGGLPYTSMIDDGISGNYQRYKDALAGVLAYPLPAPEDAR